MLGLFGGDDSERDRVDSEEIPDGLVPEGMSAEEFVEDGPQFARRYVSGEPLLGSRSDRQEELQRAALAYVLLNGLGTHFLIQSNGLDLDLTREEVEELREAAFDPSTNPRHSDLYMFLQRRL